MFGTVHGQIGVPFIPLFTGDKLSADVIEQIPAPLQFSPNLFRSLRDADWLWLSNARRIPPDWEITVSDFSAGMVEEQCQALSRLQRGFEFREIDIQAIPYEDDTFDGVIANNIRYPVPDRARAIAEMRRILKPSGTLYTATNGEKHRQEIHQRMQPSG